MAATTTEDEYNKQLEEDIFNNKIAELEFSLNHGEDGRDLDRETVNVLVNGIARQRKQIESLAVLCAERNEDLWSEMASRLASAEKSNAFLQEQLSQLANFNPDWDRLEALTDAHRETCAELKAARDALARQDTTAGEVIYQYRIRNHYNGLASDWQTIRRDQVDFVLKSQPENVEFQILQKPEPRLAMSSQLADAVCNTAAEIHNRGGGVTDDKAQEIIDRIRIMIEANEGAPL